MNIRQKPCSRARHPAIQPSRRFTRNSATAIPIDIVEWSLTKDWVPSLPATRTSRPGWSTKGRGRFTIAEIGRLASSATATASGAQSSPATATGASGRRRARSQPVRHRAARPSRMPYSPVQETRESSQAGEDFARPLTA